MQITVETVQAGELVTILRLTGNLDSSSAGYLDDRARQVIDKGAKNILLDFTAVPFMSSVGIRTLSAIYDWLHPVANIEEKKAISSAVHNGTYRAPHLKLLNPNESILKTLRLVAFDRYLPVYTDEAAALAAFS